MTTFGGIILAFTLCVENLRVVSAALEICRKITFVEIIFVCDAQYDLRNYIVSPNSIKHSLITSKFNFTLNSQSFLQNFPIDPVDANYVRRVRGALFSKSLPTPLKGRLQLVAWSEEVLRDELDLDPNIVHSEEFIHVVSGNALLANSTPLAHRYGGHQFGVWAGQLGDGRAHLLGEYRSRRGERWEVQLKGSGKTPYSREGDGRAVLRSSVREFLASEAMYHLGIPTSRAATLIMSEEQVKRDQFYNGRVTLERTAVVLRLAPSWLRFGSLEILAADEVDNRLLRLLADSIISQHFPDINEAGPERYLALFSSIVAHTAQLMAQWLCVGFAHGVMNTDNMSMVSVSLDYGPFRFLDEYDPNTVPNTSDDEARYAYRKQPEVAKYNLEKLSIALRKLLPSNHYHQLLKQILSSYDERYREARIAIFRHKLGLDACPSDALAIDEALIDELLSLMEAVKADFTMTFRQLGDLDIDWLLSAGVKGDTDKDNGAISLNSGKDARVNSAKLYYRKDDSAISAERADDISSPMNKIKHETIIEGIEHTDYISYSLDHSIDQTLSNLDPPNVPKFTEHHQSYLWALEKLRKHPKFLEWLESYRQRLRTCNITDMARRRAMSGVNPRYILRNWMAQEAIEATQNGDFAPVRRLAKILRNPYVKQEAAERLGFAGPPPYWADNIKVSCSS